MGESGESGMGKTEQAVNAGVVRGVGVLRGWVQRYPLLSVLGGAGAAYMGGQYGPAIRAGIRLLAPVVGLSCSE